METNRKSRQRTYLIAVLLGAILAALYLVSAILQSGNSTSAIGFFYLPFFGLAGAFLGWILAYLGFFARDLLARDQKISPGRYVTALAIFLLLAVLAYAIFRPTPPL